jgi:hypothetical protein
MLLVSLAAWVEHRALLPHFVPGPRGIQRAALQFLFHSAPETKPQPTPLSPCPTKMLQNPQD